MVAEVATTLVDPPAAEVTEEVTTIDDLLVEVNARIIECVQSTKAVRSRVATSYKSVAPDRSRTLQYLFICDDMCEAQTKCTATL